MISDLELEPLKEIQDRLHCNRGLEVLRQFLRLFIPKQERGPDIFHLSPINSPSNILIGLNRYPESIDYNLRQLASPSSVTPRHSLLSLLLFDPVSQKSIISKFVHHL